MTGVYCVEGEEIYSSVSTNWAPLGLNLEGMACASDCYTINQKLADRS